MQLRFGDALLLHGSRDKFKVLGAEPDFLVLTEEAQQAPRTEKAPLALLILFAFIVSVVLGFLPIALAAVIGATAMVLTGVLTMDEAYRHIDWKSVFLIAGMLPLGIALQQTGAAEFVAQGLLGAAGKLGTYGNCAHIPDFTQRCCSGTYGTYRHQRITGIGDFATPIHDDRRNLGIFQLPHPGCSPYKQPDNGPRRLPRYRLHQGGIPPDHRYPSCYASHRSTLLAALINRRGRPVCRPAAIKQSILLTSRRFETCGRFKVTALISKRRLRLRPAAELPNATYWRGISQNLE